MSDENPLVRRTVRSGGVLLAIAAVQFVAVALWVGSRLSSYNIWTGALGPLSTAGTPWGWLFNGSLIVFGVLAALGLLFSWSAFDERPSRGIGLLCLLIGAFAAVCVGAFGLLGSRMPSGSVLDTSYVALGAAAVGFLIVASAMHRHERWRVSRAYTWATGVIGVLGLALAIVHPFGLVASTMVRVSAAIALLWAIVEGLHIALLHRFAPGLQVKVAAA